MSASPTLSAKTDKAKGTGPVYTEFHPRWYRPEISTYWWLGKWPYVKFILRELSSVAVAWTVGLLLLQIFCLMRGGGSYDIFEMLMTQPWMISLNIVAFAFLLMHSITWFNLAPKAMAVRVRGKRLPALAISGPQYLAWIVISAVILYIIYSLA